MSTALLATQQLLKPLLHSTHCHAVNLAGARTARRCQAMATGSRTGKKVLLFDVMDTIVKDPFYEHMPPHFGMTFKELLAAKHPTTWLEFERGDIGEDEALTRFWADGTTVDGDALRGMLTEQYSYLPGMQELLGTLKRQGYEMHVVSNYPEWYQLIEDKLELSQYLPWTFISCEGPMKGQRKPDAKVYSTVTDHLAIAAEEAVFIDDRVSNVDAAKEAGMSALHMTGAEGLAQALTDLGIDL